MGLDMYLKAVNKKILQEELSSVLDIKREGMYLIPSQKCILHGDLQSFTEEFIQDSFLKKIKKYKIELNRLISIEDKDKKIEQRILKLKYEINEDEQGIKNLKEKYKNTLLEYMGNKKFYDEIAVTELGYWRKHHDLNSILTRWYGLRVGEEEFNGEPFVLKKEDIAEILKIAKAEIKKLRKHSDDESEYRLEQWEDTVKIFNKALKSVNLNKETIYYSNSY